MNSNKLQINNANSLSPQRNWTETKVGITGASGALGKALTKALRSKGAFVIGFTHQKNIIKSIDSESPNEWVQWECGKEENIVKVISSIDILILNHGTNPKGEIGVEKINNALEINALSTWKLINLFEKSLRKNSKKDLKREVWVNTSEAEVQPALSIGYEISKRLIGQLVSIKKISQTKEERKNLKIRKLILGPFKSQLNPIGIMNPNKIADKILKKIEKDYELIIITPNPITYFLIPINEMTLTFYHKILNRF